jgi:hypothetical protein
MSVVLSAFACAKAPPLTGFKTPVRDNKDYKDFKVFNDLKVLIVLKSGCVAQAGSLLLALA